MRYLIGILIGLCMGQVAKAGQVEIIYGLSPNQPTRLHFVGEIELGDLDKLVSAHATVSSRLGFCGSDTGGMNCEVTFSSPGGSLLEGMLIGKWIWDNSIPTRLTAGSLCASACSLAFLGGTFMYANARGPMKVIEANSYLGFHGVSTSTDEQIELNTALEISRSLDSAILRYVREIGDIDLSWLSEVLNIPADSMYFASSPNDLMSLGLKYEGPVKRRDNFGRDVCLNIAREELGYGWLQEHSLEPSPVNESIDLRELLWKERLPRLSVEETEIISRALSLLDDYELSLLLRISSRFFENGIAQYFGLQHGGGYYMSQCLALAHDDPSEGFEVNIGIPGIGYVENFSRSWLWGHPFREPLWPPCPTDSECINASWAPGEEYHPLNPNIQVYPLIDPALVASCTLEDIGLGKLTPTNYANLTLDFPDDFKQFVSDSSIRSFKHENCHKIEINIQSYRVSDLSSERRKHEKNLLDEGRTVDPSYQPVSSKNNFWVFVGSDPKRELEYYYLVLHQPDGTLMQIDILYPIWLRDMGSQLVESVACSARLGTSGIRC